MPHTELMEARLRFLNIDRNVLSELRNAKDILEPAMDDMLDRFYSHLLKEPDLRALFVDKESIERARLAQKNHWLTTLFDGKFDTAYFEKTAQIGRAHARIGLTPNWYIGGYCEMLGQFIELISKNYSDRGKSAARIIQAVSKAVFLDMDLVVHCYLDVKDSSMRQILRRATQFTADVTQLSNDLSATATQIEATAELLSAPAVEGIGTRPMQTGAPSKHTGSGTEPIDDLRVQAEQLRRQAAKLEERLKELKFGDRLYIHDAVPHSGTIARLKALILGRE